MTRKPHEWVNVSDHPITLASGQPLEAHGGRGMSDMSDPLDRANRDEGHLIKADEEKS